MDAVEFSEENELFAQLARLERRYREQLGARLERLGLSPKDHELMAALGAGVAKTPGGLARAFNVSRQFMHRRLVALEEAGLLQRWRAGPNLDAVHVGLTRTGERVLTETRELVGGWNDAVVRRMGIQRLAALKELLDALERAVGAPARSFAEKRRTTGLEEGRGEGGCSEASGHEGAMEHGATSSVTIAGAGNQAFAEGFCPRPDDSPAVDSEGDMSADEFTRYLHACIKRG